jgi:hypothetical protein
MVSSEKLSSPVLVPVAGLGRKWMGRPCHFLFSAAADESESINRPVRKLRPFNFYSCLPLKILHRFSGFSGNRMHHTDLNQNS